MKLLILVLLIVIYVNKSYLNHSSQLLLNDGNYTYNAYFVGEKWHGAKHYCEDKKGTLAVLNTKRLLNLVKEKLTTSNSFWIGLRYINPDYCWVNGEILNQTNLIVNKNQHLCYTIKAGIQSDFDNNNCNGRKKFICGIPKSISGIHPIPQKTTQTSSVQPSTTARPATTAKPSTTAKSSTFANSSSASSMIYPPDIQSTPSVTTTTQQTSATTYTLNTERNPTSTIHQTAMTTSSSSRIKKEETSSMQASQPSSSSSSYMGTISDIKPTQTSSVHPSTAAKFSTFANSSSASSMIYPPDIQSTPSVTTTTQQTSATTYTLNTERNPTSTIHQTAMTTSSSSRIKKEETSSMQASQPSSSSSSYMGTTSDINPTQTCSVQPSTTARPATIARPATTAKPSTTARPATTAKPENMINQFHNFMEKLNTSHFDSMSELLTEYDGLIEWIDTQKDIEYNPLTDAKDIENIALEFTRQHLSSDRKKLNISNKEIAFHAILVDSDSDSDVTFPEAGEDPDVNTISLPKSLFKGQETLIVNVVYKNNISRLTPTVMEGKDNKTNWLVNTGIFSTTIFPKRKEPFEYVNITLHHIQEMEAKPHCSFWNFSIPSSFNGRWSQQGCHLVSSKNNRTVCACNHLTNFAVLMNLNSNKVPSIHKDALLVITCVGLALSLLGEVITVLLYCLFLNLRHEKIQIRVNLLCALAAAQIVFLAGIDKIEDKGLCTFIAALIHLLYLVCFCWMLMEGVYLYRMVVKVFDAHVTMRYSYIFAVGFPLCIVAISLIAASVQSEGIYSYISSEFCWIRWENGFIWSFIAPVLMLIAINTFFLFSVLKEMALMKSVKSIHSLELSSIRASARACVIILPLLGITWLFGLLSIFSSGVWWQYIFTILNTMQGFMIFVFHCLRNTELRAAIKLRYFQWESTHSSHHNHSRNSTPSKFLTFDDSEKSRSNSLPMKTKVNQVTPTA